ncbi:MAG: hypothetical protein QXL69_00485 [Candidatus Bathyarchaeia archaeon]
MNSDIVELSPGKIQDHNVYLDESNETKVKVEFSRGIVLQGTIGDLLFNITTSSKKRTIVLYIPPEFKVSGLNHIWTSITNDYRYISLSTLSDRDPIAPKWQRILVSNGTSNINSGSHIIRIFNVTAPNIVGRYFFKIYMDGISIGAKNFPTLIVSADPNPASISGTIRDGDKYSSNYGKPIELNYPEGGRVIAEGLTLDGRIVISQAFFNASAMGKYTLYGLAPGVYRLTASAAGYSNTTKPELVAVASGQSLEGVDIYMLPAPKIEGTVWSKCNGVLYPWGAISTYIGPEDGGSLVYVGTGVFPNHDYIYAFRGGGTSDFFRYDAILNKWERQQSAPGSVFSGASLAFDGLRYIYAFQGGGSNGFWRYDITNNEWEILTNTPKIVNSGGALIFAGLLYAFMGGGSNDFWSYDPTTNQWIKLQDVPLPVNSGASLAFNSKDNSIYAFVGGGSQAFLKYDPSLDQWIFLSNIPTVVNSGGSLAFNNANGLLYAFPGGNSVNFYFYDSTLNLWSSIASVPSGVSSGGALIFDSYNMLFYALVGGGSSSFYSYNVDLNSWSAIADFPSTSPRPISIEILDSLGTTKYIIQNFTDPLSNKFDFKYNGLTNLDGHIPQDGSGYISGITPGEYIIRVWVNQYVQPAIVQLFDGTEVNGVLVKLSDYKVTQYIQIDVQRTGKAEVIIYFKDPISGNEVLLEHSKTVTVSLYDHNRVLRAQNSTRVPAKSFSGLVVLTGFLGTLRDYGLPADTYLISVTVDGFYQRSDEFISIAGCNSITRVSLAVFKTGSLKLTIYSIDNQNPALFVPWRYGYLKPSPPIKVEVRDKSGVEIVATNFTFQKLNVYDATVFITGLRTGEYSIFVFTYGYVLPKSYYVFIMDGVIIDMAVNVVVGGELKLTIVVEKESILSTIDTYPYSFYAPLRIQVIDMYGQFAAANITYIPSNQSVFTIQIAGFKSYAGSYTKQRWVNYYDTTDGAVQNDYGLTNGLYTFIIFLPGFMQSELSITVSVLQGSVSGVIVHLDRLSHLSGYVYSFDKFNEMVQLNWAIVNVIGEKSTYFTSTLDGFFDLWIEKGVYLTITSLDGYTFASQVVSLPDGSDISIEIILKPYNIIDY